MLQVLGLLKVGTGNIINLFGSPYLEEAGDFVEHIINNFPCYLAELRGIEDAALKEHRFC